MDSAGRYHRGVGAGKTTLLRLCNRLEVPDEGTVRYRGRPLDDLDPLALRRRVAWCFSGPPRFPGAWPTT